ncbi:hypothetical protein Bca52824_084792 [Brassica carinata]|uniref:Knottins-like domain-containing protein n=1 Tax=Brassica carinata TaxID=52824 RepID=A0A8X7TV47_BRACI|nr:hypothetical protein Bca52824_084792 [Brassica carinata]
MQKHQQWWKLSCARGRGTWSGVCGNNNACKNQCIRLEGAQHGSCNNVFPAHKCICYFPR